MIPLVPSKILNFCWYCTDLSGIEKVGRQDGWYWKGSLLMYDWVICSAGSRMVGYLSGALYNKRGPKLTSLAYPRSTYFWEIL